MAQKKFNLFGKDEKVNKVMKRFFIQLIIVIVAWQLLYNFVLEPTRIPDKFLTSFTAAGAVVGINAFLPVDPKVVIVDSISEVAGGVNLLQNNKVVFLVADICNGLDLLVIYLGLLFLLPYYSMKRRIAFGIGGIIVIMLANIVRVTLLYWLYYFHKPMFELNHKYIFTLVLYLIIFIGWILFTRKGLPHEKS